MAAGIGIISGTSFALSSSSSTTSSSSGGVGGCAGARASCVTSRTATGGCRRRLSGHIGGEICCYIYILKMLELISAEK